MKVLHTSDWHIGKTLYGHTRYAEFELFLSWLAETIVQQAIDVVLIAGDIFDTSAPSNRSQELYYRFLCEIAKSNCRHVIIIAGNHDSPSFLNAPKALLRTLNVHVVGNITDNIRDEVLCLESLDGKPELIVCAIPYLRDKDIRTVSLGESIDDKARKFNDGLKTHYAQVCELAEEMRCELKLDIPIVAMGHLFAAGGATIDGDGVRDLYVGSLSHMTAAMFPANIDYLALGHLHVPQCVNSSENMRYSGSPIPMGFGEALQEKSVCVVNFINRRASITLIIIPVFQELMRIRGNFDEISAAINALVITQRDIWVEVIYDGDDVEASLQERLNAQVVGTAIQILRIKNNRLSMRIINQISDNETLDDLTIHDVFERYLSIHDVPEDQRIDLKNTYAEAVMLLYSKVS